MAEPRDVGGLGQIRRGRDEQRPAVLAQRDRIHVRAPGGQAGPVRRLLTRLLPHALGVIRHVEDAPVGEDPGRAEPESVDFLGHRPGDRQQPVRQPGDQVIVAPQHAHRHPQVRLRLRLHSGGVSRGGGAETFVGHPVAVHEPLTCCPELRGVHGPGRAVAGRVHLAVAAALLRDEPRHGRLPARAAGSLQDRPGDRPPLHAVLGAGDPPAVGREPVRRRARHHARGWPRVDAEVVPVDHEDQVVQAQAPRGVLGLVGRTRGEPALALEDEDLHLAGAGQLQGERLARGWRHAVPGGAGVELQEERLALHLGVPGQAAAPTEAEQPFPGQRPLAVVGKGELGRPGALVPGPDGLVEHREGGVDERHRMAGREHETVTEPSPRPQHVPAHGARQQQGQHHVHLGS